MSLSLRWHTLTHGHITLVSPEGEDTMIQICWRRVPPRTIKYMVKEDGVIRELTKAQFHFWAKGKGLTVPPDVG